jgi:hypothetical protein
MPIKNLHFQFLKQQWALESDGAPQYAKENNNNEPQGPSIKAVHSIGAPAMDSRIAAQLGNKHLNHIIGPILKQFGEKLG